jgi:hypothetical protein
MAQRSKIDVVLLSRACRNQNRLVLAIETNGCNVLADTREYNGAQVGRQRTLDQNPKPLELANQRRRKSSKVVAIDAGDWMPITPPQQQSA